MKNNFILFIFVSNIVMGQSTLILPQAANASTAGHILKTNIGALGYNHTNGTVGVGTYVGSRAYLQTHTAHSLHFTVNNGSPAVTLSYSTDPGLNKNLGIGTETPQEKLHVVGKIRSSTLSGTGERNVYADANGTLTTTPKTEYLSLPPSSFVLKSNFGASSLSIENEALYFNTTASAPVLLCPLRLPHGATITSIRINYLDNSTYTSSFELHVSPLNGSATTVTPLGSTTNSLSGNATTSLNLVVDNSTKGYFIKVNFFADNGDMRLLGAIVTYTY